MTHDDDNSGDLPELSNRELLRILMQEIVDTRNELKEDIAYLDQRVGKVESEVHTLRLEVHQNHSSFIANQTILEKRVIVLEMAGSKT